MIKWTDCEQRGHLAPCSRSTSMQLDVMQCFTRLVVEKVGCTGMGSGSVAHHAEGVQLYSCGALLKADSAFKELA